MHFFSPAHVMPLLENVRGKATDAVTVATIMAVGKRLKKKAVLAANGHGFIGNRMLEGYVTEALYMLEEGCYPAEVHRSPSRLAFALCATPGWTSTDRSASS